MSCRVRLLLLLFFLVMATGCVRPHWQPPPPSGKTWAYEAQGAFRESRAFGVGRLGPANYGYFFGHAGLSDMPRGQAPDVFWKSHTLKTTRFNAHLGTAGERLRPSAEGHVSDGTSREGDASPAPRN
jgi:hypothetical protein